MCGQWDGETERRTGVSKDITLEINKKLSPILMKLLCGSIGLLIGIVGVFEAYTFTEVTNIPKTYATKADVAGISLKIDGINTKVDNGFSEIMKYLINTNKNSGE